MMNPSVAGSRPGIRSPRRPAWAARRRASRVPPRDTALVALLLHLVVALPAFGWGAHGHRTITYVALARLPAGAPAWLRDPAVQQRIAHQSNQADRWRGWRAPALEHENAPDHYLDAELLEQFGLTLETVPRLRNEYLRALVISKHEHPEQVEPYDAARDPNRSKEWPGFVLHAVAEHYAKLQQAFQEVRILEELGEPARAYQLEIARSNAIYHMGMLAHFVGDIAQPLHTTRHYDGWVGDNPSGYRWRERFHSYIDSGVVAHHGIDYATLHAATKFETRVNPADTWDDVLVYFRRSFQKMEPLYRLETDGRLDGPDGRAFILERMADAAAMLSAMYWAAYTSAAPSRQHIADFVRYNEPASEHATPPPTTRPAQ